ncbi:unnamed protein product [Auanema sp. JU1783]|nr:unnamed protein product [Auanema sp. JU1783]
MSTYLDKKYGEMIPECSVNESEEKSAPVKDIEFLEPKALNEFELEDEHSYCLTANGMKFENLNLQESSFSTTLNYYTFLMDFICLMNHDVKLFCPTCPDVYVHFKVIKIYSTEKTETGVSGMNGGEFCYYSEVTLKHFPLAVLCSGYGLTPDFAKSSASKVLIELWGNMNLLPNFLLHDIATSGSKPHTYPKITEILLGFLPTLLRHNCLNIDMTENSFVDVSSPKKEETEGETVHIHPTSCDSNSNSNSNACLFFTQKCFPLNDEILQNIMVSYPNQTIIIHPWFISGSNHPYFHYLPSNMKKVIVQNEINTYEYIRKTVRLEERQKIIDEFPPTVRDLLYSQNMKKHLQNIQTVDPKPNTFSLLC